MAHEYSKTFKVGKDWVNAPSMHKGKSLSEDELMEKVSKGEIKPTSTHKTLQEALDAAEKRSKSFNNQTHKKNGGLVFKVTNRGPLKKKKT
jgi:hypothetical protein